MKNLVLVLALLAVSAFGADWIYTEGGAVQGRPGPLPVIWHGAENALQNLTDAQRYAEGWRTVAYEGVPAGMQATGWAWVVGAEVATYAPTGTEPIPPAPEPIPARFDDGIDASMLVLDTADGKGVGYVAGEDGELIPVVYAHASPYPPAAELAARIAAAREARKMEKAKRNTDAKAAQTASNAANSVPVLRAQVAELARIIAEMTAAKTK